MYADLHSTTQPFPSFLKTLSGDWSLALSMLALNLCHRPLSSRPAFFQSCAEDYFKWAWSREAFNIATERMSFLGLSPRTGMVEASD